MRCEEIMKRDVECVGPNDTIRMAARKMRQANIGFLPVCDQDCKPLGTLTDRDIAIRVVGDDKPYDIKVSDVMTRELVAVLPEDDLHAAERVMSEHKKSRLMVCNQQGDLIGVISLSDIAKYEPSDFAASTLKEVSTREARV